MPKQPPRSPKPTPPVSAASSRLPELIARALAHVDANLDQPLSADVLADKAALSRHHFHRVFHAHVGCGVGAYVTWRRLQRACALLASGREPVLDIALSVGFESAQSLAKALRRELDTTPTAMRRGDAAAWTNLLPPWRTSERYPILPPSTGDHTMHPSRYADLPSGLTALTATARGMVQRTMVRAAQQAYAEVMPAAQRAGAMPRLRSCISIVPDEPQGPDDPHCRYVAGLVFGYALADGSGQCEQPDIPLTGSLAWQTLAPGRHAVFLHTGPYDTLHHTWTAIYRDWLPASGETLRDDPPLELVLNDPKTTPPADLLTEIWVPVV